MYNSIFQYNDLDKSKVYRSELLELIELAKSENQTFIVQKISDLLNQNPDDKCFRITLKSKIPTFEIEDGLFGAFEPVPAELQGEQYEVLHGGLAGRSLKPFYHSLIKKLFGKLNINENPEIFYDRPSELIKKYPKIKNYIPHSYVSRKPYQGLNILNLSSNNGFSAFKNPYFITKKQIENQKGMIKKGVNAESLMFFKLLESEHSINEDIPVIVNYEVYNVADVSGISEKPPKQTAKAKNIDTKKTTKKAVATPTKPKPTAKAKIIDKKKYIKDNIKKKWDNINSPQNRKQFLDRKQFLIHFFNGGYTEIKKEGNSFFLYNPRQKSMAETTGKGQVFRDFIRTVYNSGFSFKDVMSELTQKQTEIDNKKPTKKAVATPVKSTAKTKIIRIKKYRPKPKSPELQKALDQEKSELDYQAMAMEFFINGGAISQRSATKEVTGLKRNGKSRQVFKWVTRFKKDALLPSVEGAAHQIWENRGGYETNIDTQEIRNAIIDVISSYSSIKDIEEDYIELYGKIEENYKKLEEYYAGAAEEAERIAKENGTYQQTEAIQKDEDCKGEEIFEGVWTDPELDVNSPCFNKEKYEEFEKGMFAPTYNVPDNPKVEQVLEWAKQNLYGTHIYHRDIGKKIHFRQSGIKKAIYGKRGISKIRLQLVYVAKQILQSARLITIEKDNKKRLNVAKVYKLACFHTLNGQEYRIFIVIRETANGTLYYEHEGVKIQKHARQTGDASKVATSTPLSTPNVFDHKDTKKSLHAPKSSIIIPMNAKVPKNATFKIPKQTADFLGNIEIKPQHSVVATLDAPQGAGKTRFFYFLMNQMASTGNKCLFISMEEHPLSELAQSKKKQYIKPKNQALIDTLSELPTYNELCKIIEKYDCVFIDSWGKMQTGQKIDFDRDLRKKFNGKLFFVIFQRTVNQTMRGGASAQFDGDIIMKINKDKNGDFKQNYVYHDKNRYQSKDLNSLKFNIYKQKII